MHPEFRLFTGECIVKAKSVVGTPAVIDSTVYVGDRDRGTDGTDEPKFHALDAVSGDEQWQLDLDYVRSAVVADGGVFLTSGATIYALDAGAGKIEWTVERELGRGAVLFPAVANDTLYVTDGSGTSMDSPPTMARGTGASKLRH